MAHIVSKWLFFACSKEPCFEFLSFGQQLGNFVEYNVTMKKMLDYVALDQLHENVSIDWYKFIKFTNNNSC